MQIFSLQGLWDIRSSCGTYELQGEVPGSFFHTLEQSGFWADRGGDAFFGENHWHCEELANRDFCYSRSFVLPASFWTGADEIFLEADGLDTLARVVLNGHEVAATENMHRRYAFPVSKLLQLGRNQLEIHFGNTLTYIRKKQQERYIWAQDYGTVGNFNRIRKCASSFGWDWGPSIPDIGIWRDIRLCAVSRARLGQTVVQQQHGAAQEPVKLQLHNALQLFCDKAGLELRYSLYSPEGALLAQVQATDLTVGAAEFLVPQAQLWWPNNYGEQPLYKLVSELYADGELLEKKEQQLGLRTMEIERKPDEDGGESFGIRVNGVTIFAMGGNFIPQDVYLTRPDSSDTERLLHDCAAANFNMLRIWGGGIFPSDAFYDLCDRLGLLVWQDLLFACAFYGIQERDFREEVRLEVLDNIGRLRHHACLALVCGNNEMEWAFEEWPIQPTKRDRAEYTFMYEFFFPELMADHFPEIPYWKASPSSGGFFDEPNDPMRGDVHYWDVWIHGAPFTDYRKHKFRFLSEYGFQSFPCYRTLCSFTEASERNPYSAAIEAHQRYGDGRGTQQLMSYLGDYFLLGSDMEEHCYLSQVNQAEACRVAIEHLRQNRRLCGGTLYWQVNDNWPVASWSSIDYFGRWKALHYMAKRVYAPVQLSCREQDAGARLFVSTERSEGFTGLLQWALKDMAGTVLRSGEHDVNVAARAATEVVGLDFSEDLTSGRERTCYLSATLQGEGIEPLRLTTCFARYKFMAFGDPQLRLEIQQSDAGWQIRVRAERYAKFVELYLQDRDAVFSDNYFDLDAGEERIISLIRIDGSADGDVLADLRVRSLGFFG